MALYEIISYEVWGNPKDGWEVNDAHYTDSKIEIPENSTDLEILNLLKGGGLVKDDITLNDISIDGESEYSFYVNDDRQPDLKTDPDFWYGKPVYELRKCL